MARLLCGLLFLLSVCSVRAEDVQVAVAANFAVPMQHLAALFEKSTGHRAVLSFGSTGKFYAQIKNGAPFDMLLAADQATPAQLSSESVPGTQFTYAIGSLVLWSATPGLVDAQGAVLKLARFNHLAIASARQAPYGAAAVEVLKSLHLFETLAPKIVQGESIGQTYAFVATGNAELGFVALSQVWENDRLQAGSVWMVPDTMYAPLRQDAILLRHGKDNPAAIALMAYLKTAAAQSVMRSYGYRF